MKTNEIDQVVQLVGQLIQGNMGNRLTVELLHGFMYLLKENLLRWPQDAGAEAGTPGEPSAALQEAQHG